jgi:hypothetical protein
MKPNRDIIDLSSQDRRQSYQQHPEDRTTQQSDGKSTHKLNKKFKKKMKTFLLTQKPNTNDINNGTEKKLFYYKVYYTHMLHQKHKKFEEGILEVERRVDPDGHIEFKHVSDEYNSERYLNVLATKKEIRTISIQAILKPGKASLFNEYGKEIKMSYSFVADFN